MFINTKKALAISGIIFCLSAESMDVGSWAKCAHMFKSENDLIKGYVLQNSKLIEGQRFFGPVHLYFNENEMRRDLLLRSFLDSSDDPMTDLIILLFPSAGLGFNAEGTGSFSNVNRTILVAGMLNLANVIRSGEQGVISRITEVDKSNKKEEIERFVSEIFDSLKESYDGFVISDGQNNIERFQNKRVYYLSQLEQDKDCVFFIAMEKESIRKVIYNDLENKGYKHFIDVNPSVFLGGLII